MFESSADLITGWQAECATLEQKIASLQTGVTGHSLTPSQRAAIINEYLEVIAEFKSLIADFSRCEVFPIMVDPVRPGPEPIVRLRYATNRQPAIA